MLIGNDNDLIYISIHRALSLMIVKCHNLEPVVDPSFCPLVWPLVVPTWGSDFSDLDIRTVPQAALPLNAILQDLQHPHLWELRHDLQVFDWNIKLGPIEGKHTLTGVSRGEREMGGWEVRV